jgi:hypothetical protein
MSSASSPLLTKPDDGPATRRLLNDDGLRRLESAALFGQPGIIAWRWRDRGRHGSGRDGKNTSGQSCDRAYKERSHLPSLPRHEQKVMSKKA